MTTLTLTIGGVDFLPNYVTGSAKVTENIQNQGNTLDLSLAIKSGQTLPTIGAEIILKDGTRYLFGGFITKLDPTEYGIGQLIEYSLEATDYTYLLINKTAQKSYANQTLHAIVADLITTNVHSGYGLTTTNVATGPTLVTVAFNHITLRKCLENLAKLTSFIWWVDYQKNIYFVDPNATTSAPEKISDTSGNHESVAITLDISQVRNDIVVLGGTQESANYTQDIAGDGKAREWVLLYPVTTMVSIKVNGVAKVVGVDPADSDTGNDFMYSPTRGSIRATATTTTPISTDTIEVIYTYPLPVITEVQDASSVAALKAIEGGDGVHTYTITDSTILSQSQAQQRALKELAQFSNPILSGTFVTRTSLLTAGSIFAAGQALTVNLPSWGLSTDTTYIIQKVVTSMTEAASGIEYQYEVTFGGRLLGVTDFLIALATPEEPLDTSGEVQIIKSVPEIITITETITRNSNTKNVAETVTTAESISKVNFTPPYQWQPSANPAKWGEAEWG